MSGEQDVAAIAAGLTKAQRGAILRANSPWGVFGTQPFRNRLAQLGLCTFDPKAGRSASWLLDLGVAVRAHLLSNTPTQVNEGDR